MAKKAKAKNKKPSQVWKKYKVDSGRLVRQPLCPKCEASFLSIHKDRHYCGKCHYVEFLKK